MIEDLSLFGRGIGNAGHHLLPGYLDDYHGSRTHPLLVNDIPDAQPISRGLATGLPFPEVGGLHHHHQSLAA